MNILIISDALPYPPDSGAKIRNFNIIKHLSERHRIFLVALIASLAEKRFVPEVEKYCAVVKLVLLEKHTKLWHLPGVIKCLLSGQPLDNKFMFLAEMERNIRQLVASEKFDIIQFEHSHMGPYIGVLPKNNLSKRILTFHNVGFVQIRRMFEVEKNPYKKIRLFLNWFPMQKWEPAFAAHFDKCIVTSLSDKEALKAVNPELDIAVVPNGVDVDNQKPLVMKYGSHDILFIGAMDYEPNIDAVLYFHKEIFSIIKERIVDCRFFIVGGGVGPEVRQLAKNNEVIITGRVENIYPYYERCMASIVPLRAGGGTRLKILESMALGRPVVSTSLGCEGLEVVPGKDILIADNPDDFARNVVELITDADLWQRVSENARRLVECKYGWNKISTDLIGIYDSLAANNSKIERK